MPVISRNWGSARKFKHPLTGNTIAKVLPGEFYLTAEDELIHTVLGSCVCACIRDPIAKIGGMNHFMLAGSIPDLDPLTSGSQLENKNRYGQHAMDNLIQHLISAGCEERNLEVKIFGGGHVMEIATDVGAANVSFALEYFANAKLNIVASDLGDRYPRKIVYNPINGKVKMMKLRGAYSGLVSSSEKLIQRNT